MRRARHEHPLPATHYPLPATHYPLPTKLFPISYRDPTARRRRVSSMRRWTMAAVLLWMCVAAASQAADHHVTINSMSFSPDQLTVAPGDTVIWTVATGVHTTTSNTAVWDSP